MDNEITAGKLIKGLLTGFLIGGAIGGAIALLYAPKSGKLLRDDISRKTNELIGEGKIKSEQLWNDTKEQVGSTLDSANDFLNTSKEKIRNKTEKVKDAFKAGVSAYNEERKYRSDENILSGQSNDSIQNQIT